MMPVYTTYDVDYFIPHFNKISGQIDLSDIFEKLGFICDVSGSGITKFINRDLEVEFLTPARRNNPQLAYIKELKIKAQTLDSLKTLPSFTEEFNFRKLKILMPIPIYYIVHKILTSAERKGKFKGKSGKDIDLAIELLKIFKDNEHEMNRYKDVYYSLSKRKQKLFNKIIEDSVFDKYRNILEIE